MKKQSGFTLIELMIVVAIIGILASIALPGYQDYTIRARVTEGLAILSGAKATIAENIANAGGTIGSGVCSGVNTNFPSGSEITSMNCSNGSGEIEVHMSALAGSVQLHLRPTANANTAVDWACRVDSTSSYKYVPAECRT